MSYARRNILLGLLVALVAGVALFFGSSAFFRTEEVNKAQARLSLHRGLLVAEVGRFAHLTFVLARDAHVQRATLGRDRAALNSRLAAFAEQAGLEAIYLMDMTGLTIAASNAGQPGTFLGQNYGFRPYFREAAAGRHGTFYGIGATTRRPGYFIADPVRGPSGDVVAVIAIKIDLGTLSAAWAESGENVLLANDDGVVFLASDPAWRYRALQPLTTAQRADIRAGQQFADEPLTPLNWDETGDQGARIGAKAFLHVTSDALPHGWVLHYFADPRAMWVRSWLTVVIAAVVAAATILITQARRNVRIRQALHKSEAEEAALREANARLAVEIEERRTAQRRLHRTQDELARASRLAVLGQLAASVTHELGQPIAAMKNHLTAAEISGQSGRMTGRLQGLVARMEAITRQLKFFASPAADEALEPVDLNSVVDEARALLAPNIATLAVEVQVETSTGPLQVHGNRMRLEQVMTNLMRNALDAMEDTDTPRRLRVGLAAIGDEATVTLQDTGTGLRGADLSDLQEPFVTTRSSGQGMGLGLAISGEILREHGGQMSARDLPEGGAEFRVTLPLIQAGREAAE